MSVKSKIIAINKRATHGTEGHLFYYLGGQQIALSDRLRHCVITVCRDGLEGAIRWGMSGADVKGKPD